MDVSATGRGRLTARIEEWVADDWDVIFGTAAAGAFAASGVVASNPGDGHWYSWALLPWLLLIVGTVLFLLAAVSAARKSGRFSEMGKQLATSERDRAALQNDLDEARLSVNRIMDKLCGHFATAMLATTTERVSIYSLHPDDCFVRIARRSANPIFELSGRVKYPIDEGVVAEAWADIFAMRAPPRSKCANDRQWAHTMEELSGISTKKLKAMTMKSKVLLAQRITDDTSGRPCAVLVYESMMFKNDLDRRFLSTGHSSSDAWFRELFGEDLGVALIDAVAIASRLAQQIDLNLAAQEGF